MAKGRSRKKNQAVKPTATTPAETPEKVVVPEVKEATKKLKSYEAGDEVTVENKGSLSTVKVSSVWAHPAGGQYLKLETGQIINSKKI